MPTPEEAEDELLWQYGGEDFGDGILFEDAITTTLPDEIFECGSQLLFNPHLFFLHFVAAALAQRLLRRIVGGERLHALLISLALLTWYSATSSTVSWQALLLPIAGSVIVQCHLRPTRHFGLVVTLLYIALLTAWEWWRPGAEAEHDRGWLVLSGMRLSALAFDREDERLEKGTQTTTRKDGRRSWLAVVCYQLNPGTLLFGPFVSFDQHEDSLQPVVPLSAGIFLDELKEILLASLNWLAGHLLFVYSSCVPSTVAARWSDDAADFSNSPRLLVDYMRAHAFRSSHYAVSLTAQSMWRLSGGEPSVRVVRPSAVELPRSMVDVVVQWNVPMHLYLHTYVHRRVRASTGSSALALFSTFVVSSGLHGMDARLSSVLVSLAVYAYAENVLREALSSRFDACIRAKDCISCTHSAGRPTRLIVNGAFCLFNVYHLIYLGMVFEPVESDDVYQQQRSWWLPWLRHSFASPLLALLTWISGLLLAERKKKKKQKTI